MNIRLNRDPVDVPGQLTTWGDLLDWLENDYLNAGQCITSVSFGDQEAMRYRESTVCGQKLHSLEQIDIESGDFDSVVVESLGELDRELDHVAEAGAAIVRLFESRNQGQAYEALSQYLESLAVLFSIFSEDLGWVHEEGNDSRTTLTASLEQALGELVSAQENGFWISVCDVLEYEIAPVLDGWKSLVKRTRGRVN